MKFALTAATALSLLALPALADSHGGPGDPEKGEKEFRKCKSCHMIESDSGETIVKGGKTGPNLYGIIGREMGSFDDFRYSKLLEAAHEQGLVWDAANLAEFVTDPSAFLNEATGEKGRSKMTLKLRKGGEDVAAYLASVAPAPEEAAAD